MTRFAIRGGRVVTPNGVRRADVVVDGSRLGRIGPGEGRGLTTVDASGCYVLPGGVDPHVHAIADVASATRSAAFGGTTTVMSFTNPQPGERAARAARRDHGLVSGNAAVDVALHAVIGAPAKLDADDLEQLRQLGIRGIKVFLAYPEQGLMTTDDRLYQILTASARLGFTVLVHAENGYLVQALIDENLRHGRSELIYFVRSRPPAVEEEAVSRTIRIARLAGGVPYFVHTSTGGAIDLIRAAREEQPVYAEVCTHHLVLDAGRYRSTRADRFLVVPPLRPSVEVEALWRAVRAGTVDTLGSDHSQSRYQPPHRSDFTGLPYGLPGVELRMPLVLSEGLQRKIPIQRLSALLSTGPAKIFGLYPRKGAIVRGADADLVIWDPRPRWRVTSGSTHDGLGWTPYTGLRVQGMVRDVFLRGSRLVADRAFVGPANAGLSLEQ